MKWYFNWMSDVILLTRYHFYVSSIARILSASFDKLNKCKSTSAVCNYKLLNNIVISGKLYICGTKISLLCDPMLWSKYSQTCDI